MSSISRFRKKQVSAEEALSVGMFKYSGLGLRQVGEFYCNTLSGLCT
ncbi:MAG: hypothetical protein AB8B87_20220 [Granulosicoccus sp.]